jgi:hypothetical protein
MAARCSRTAIADTADRHRLLRPGVDAGKLNALVDELEDDAAIASFRS